MKRYKKLQVTLIEVVIASSLLMVLLTALLGLYYNVSQSYQGIQTIHQEAFKKRYVQNRLTQIFSNITETHQNNLQVCFLTVQDTQATKGSSLIFSLDSKEDVEPTFSGYTLGRLYVNHQQQLCFSTWPGSAWKDRKDTDPLPVMKHEVLLEDVESIRFKFYAAPADDSTAVLQVDPEKQFPNYDSWENDIWKNEYLNFPTVVHLSINTKSNLKVYEYQFVLPYINSYIKYKG